MRKIEGLSLWIGTARDARDIKLVLDNGIEAIIDLALEERPVSPTRELIYLRLPLLDGAGNSQWLLQTASNALEDLMKNGVQTLVACGAGMSRSPAVAAVAIAKFLGKQPIDVLVWLQSFGPQDVSPALWQELTTTRRCSTTNNEQV
jgi:hypothetical protein